MTVKTEIEAAKAALHRAKSSLVAAIDADKTRMRGPKIRQLHEIRRMLEPGYPYFSQAGQDAIVDRILGHKDGGTFLDIGGYDGITGSNTLFFELRRNWTGVLVEPVTAHLKKAAAARKCPCVGCAVAKTDGTQDLMEIHEGYTQMSGLVESYEPAMLQQVRNNPRHRETVVKVETRTLKRIVSDAGLKSVDFISLDIEGGEFDVLKTFPFEEIRVSVWAIENNTGKPDMALFMRDKGYDLVEFCGPDEIYVSKDLAA